MNKKKAVIFDLDGVIVSTDQFHYKAWKTIADRENIFFDYEKNHRLRGVSRMESLEIILEDSKKEYNQEEKNDFANDKNNIYKELLKELSSSDILEGVEKILEKLKKLNIKTAIGSSSKNAKLILGQIGMIDHFDIIVDGNDIKNSKPDPEVFLLAAKKLGIDTKECIVVEDANAGIISANNANIFSVFIGEEENANANISFKSMSEMNIEEIL